MRITDDFNKVLTNSQKVSKLLEKLNQGDFTTPRLKSIASDIELQIDIAEASVRLFSFALTEASLHIDLATTVLELKKKYPDSTIDGENCFDFLADEIRKNSGIVNSIKRSLNLDNPNGIESIRILCDLRPVFSYDKASISSLQYVSLLRIETKDDHTKMFELSEDLLNDLKAQCEYALGKIAIMKKSFAKE